METKIEKTLHEFFKSILNFCLEKKGQKYKINQRLNSFEKIIRTEDHESGPDLNWICDQNGWKIFWVDCQSLQDTKSLTKLPNNNESLNNFSLLGYRMPGIVKNWPEAKKMPSRLYFFNLNEDSSHEYINKICSNIGENMSINSLALFNAKYKEFNKYFPNAATIADWYVLFFTWERTGNRATVNKVTIKWPKSTWFAVAIEDIF